MNMAGIFDHIQIISVILFATALVGVMVYERTRTRQSKGPESSTT